MKAIGEYETREEKGMEEKRGPRQVWALDIRGSWKKYSGVNTGNSNNLMK